ncbi:hypothetical protein CANCADRAFT_32377 [Tortispora caseinolytica NRRL Y-17796]|uniref:Malic enzyme n=1 Tax=Tortispora caseinolytica NRRL Y-17796 TaxID=767744 RepID=A0A1E4TB55_9ASCO|nr:hypothetical protein CANCADRAFT_32377 [Tortispora caseinolytica NRRL Y-17796]
MFKFVRSARSASRTLTTSAPGPDVRGRLSVSKPLLCNVSGKTLLDNPDFNKGSAFTDDERAEFDLHGLLPLEKHSLEVQVLRAYSQFQRRPTPLHKNTFLTSLKYQNTVLYYRLILDHLKEMMGIIYTPTQGEYIENYSRLFRRPDGCFLDIYHPELIETALSRWGGPDDIDYIVVSDSEGILGIGDQGVGGIGICTAKLALVTLCGGLHPSRALPVVLDTGTDNERLLNDPLYLGLRRHRVRGHRYDDFVDAFMTAVKKKFPNAIVHFEDFGLNNAYRLLHKYADTHPCFNDDIQGTGAVTAAALLAALKSDNKQLDEARIVVFGAGSGGMGVVQMFYDVMLNSGVDAETAKKNIYLVDRPGLLTKSMGEKLTPAQAIFAADDDIVTGFDPTNLTEIIGHIKPHVLVGTSTKAGAFTEEVVREMTKHVDKPIIFPLSNPTKLCEAVPADVLEWSDNKALVATGSPFEPVNGRAIAENNNCFVFPGIGFGSVLANASKITLNMILAAVYALSEMAPILKDSQHGALLPDVSDIRDVSAVVATNVLRAAVKDGVSRVDPQSIPETYDDCLEWVRDQMWKPEYRRLERVY